MKNSYKFLAILECDEESIGVYFPDLPGCITGAETLDEAIQSADEVLKLHLYGMERDNEDIPEPCSLSSLTLDKNEMVIVVDVHMKAYREKRNEQYIKKTLSIPNWINTLAEEKGVNFSKTLQNALIEQLELH